MRRVYRSLIDWFFAISLLLLAVSPVTAPFTTCALSDYLTPHSNSPSHPGNQLAVPHARVAGLVVTAPSLQTESLGVLAAPRCLATPFVVACAGQRSTRQRILRL